MDKDLLYGFVQDSQEPGRFKHTLGTIGICVELAKLHGVDSLSAELAGLLHDCARDFSRQKVTGLLRKFGNDETQAEYARWKQYPSLVHGYAAKLIAKNMFGINRPALLEALEYHSTGKARMGLLLKILYIADLTEPGRKFPFATQILDEAINDIDRGLWLSCRECTAWIARKGKVLHPDSIEMYQALAARAKKLRWT